MSAAYRGSKAGRVELRLSPADVATLTAAATQLSLPLATAIRLLAVHAATALPLTPRGRKNASLASQVESMAMRIESLAEELAKPEDVRLREVLDALDGRAVIFDGLGARVGHLLDEMDEWIGRAGAAERRLKKAEKAGVK